MIAVELKGRLGNQLFQYAFAYSTSKKLGVKCYFDKRLQVEVISKYFVINLDLFQILDTYIFSIRGYNNFFNSYLKRKFYSLVKKLFNLNVVEISDTEKPELELKKTANKTYYRGYYQSEKYFSQFRADILELFKIKPKFIEAFQIYLSELSIPSDYTVVHIRRSDYLDYNYALPIGYFHKAIEMVSDEKNFVIFISDDYEFVAEHFKYVKKKHISKESEIIDLQFLINAKTCIISNSSFSWWGAYLNNKNAQVITPKYWIGQTNKMEYPTDIILDTWIELEII